MRGKKNKKLSSKNKGDEKINSKGGRWHLYRNFTDGFTDEHLTPSVNFEFCSRIF
jgi:hypothetical protein